MIRKNKNIIRDLYYPTKIDKKVYLQWLGSKYGGAAKSLRGGFMSQICVTWWIQNNKY